MRERGMATASLSPHLVFSFKISPVMQNSSVASRLALNLSSAALRALKIGKEVKLSLCPSSTEAQAVFRIIEDSGRPNYDHPVIPVILIEATEGSNHCEAMGNTIKLK